MSDTTTALTREEVAKLEIGHTDLSKGTAWTLALAFVLGILLVPIVQFSREGKLPGGATIGKVPGRASTAFDETEGSLFRRSMAANRSILRDIHAYEDDLEEDSFLTTLLVPPVQHFMARRLGAGNEKAYIGRDQWLFYRPGLDYLTGPGFLNARRLESIANSGNEWTSARQPDPRKAILHFRDQLAARDIALVLVPTPVKPAVHPEQFSKRYSRSISETPLHNVSYVTFIEELRGQGVLICELDSVLSDRSEPLYLATDTHWRPETMAAVAQRLGSFIEENAALPSSKDAGYKRIAETVTNLGDVAQMMKLPQNQTLAAAETIEIQQVLTPDDHLWSSSSVADVLLLGDSFSNIYSLESMGWGSAAGLAEQLSYALQRPLDCIVRNDEGSHATRGALSKDLARGKDRLAGKQVVVWQFAERELSVGDWKMLDLTLGTPTPSKFVTPEKGKPITVTGTVEAVSAAPRPGSVPYKDHIVTVHLRDLQSRDPAIAGGDALVYMWSMQDNVWTDAARLRGSQKLTLQLRSWYEVSAKLEAINRSELDDENLQFEDPCWGELIDEDKN